MILIWGFKAISKTLSEGTFFCPREGGDRPYRLRSARRWFTLFWIPLIPLKELGTYVECTSCKSTYYESALTAPTTSQMSDVAGIAMRHLAVSMTLADGDIDYREKEAATELIGNYITGYNETMFDDDLRQLAGANLADKLEELGAILTEQGKETIVQMAVRLAAADGSVDESELEIARQTGIALSMSAAHVRGTIDTTLEQVRDVGL